MASAREVIEGLRILSHYAAGGTDCQINGADHDVIYGLDVPQSAVSDEDKKQLDECGWFWSEEFDCWARFV